MERAVALEQTPVVLPETLAPHVGPGARHEGQSAATAFESSAPDLRSLPDLGEGFDLEAKGDEMYRHYISLALERTGGVQTKAAELLGMSFRSFRYYAKKFNIR